MKLNKYIDEWSLRIIYTKRNLASIAQARVIFLKVILMQACANCNFFDNQNQYSGSCRINPPSFLKEDNKAVWPTVKIEDWCGRFEDKAA